MTFLGVLFGFKGRITRSQYWLGALVPALIVALIIFGSMTSLMTLYRSGQSDPVAVLSVFGKLLLPAFFGLIACVWISAALYTKRLHDRDKGAVWLLAIYVPAFLPLATLIYEPKLFAASGVVSMIANLWVFIELGCMRGTDGPNRFDTDPSDGTRTAGTGSRDRAAPNEGPTNYGGLAAAMASIEAAARENRAAARAAPSPSPYGQRLPQSYSGHTPSGAGGFGRKGL